MRRNLYSPDSIALVSNMIEHVNTYVLMPTMCQMSKKFQDFYIIVVDMHFPLKNTEIFVTPRPKVPKWVFRLD